jgi:hypothetical protein
MQNGDRGALTPMSKELIVAFDFQTVLVNLAGRSPTRYCMWHAHKQARQASERVSKIRFDLI